MIQLKIINLENIISLLIGIAITFVCILLTSNKTSKNPYDKNEREKD